ncbi:MAG: hypothetical protein PHP00_01270 [Thiotrichaceae bacterium]|nr:hypothetical protein [Thiotrichaceae bacterium]
MSLPNEDQIATPTRGRFFAFSFPEILGMVREYNFQHPTYRKRIDILFFNLTSCRIDQMPIASLYPRDALYLYSFPKTFSSSRARLIVKATLQEFATLDKSTTQSKQEWSRHIDNSSFDVRLEQLNQLTIVKQHWRTNREKRYRGDDKLSSAYIPKQQSFEEKKLYTLHVTASD